MQVYLVDDEPLMLEALTEIVQEALPQAEVLGFLHPNAFLKAFRQSPGEIAFIDIEMPIMDGVTLATSLQEIKDDVNIIFVTGYDQYKASAMDMYASAYLLKPITEEKLRQALRHLRYPLSETSPAQSNDISRTVDDRLELKCFGDFDAFYRGVPLRFQHKRTKELLAYLVDRRGARVSAKQIICTLWEDDADHSAYYQTLRNDLLQTLQKIPVQPVQASYGSLSVITSAVRCDYYSFLEHDSSIRYSGEYMVQYSWAEVTKAYLDNMVAEKA